MIHNWLNPLRKHWHINTHWIVAATLLFLFATAQQTGAMPASPIPVQLTQPDGTEITLRIFGHPKFHWFEDLNGFTVVIDKKSYVYAKLDASGELAPTDLVVGKSDPALAGLSPKIKPTQRVIDQNSRQLLADPPKASRKLSTRGSSGSTASLKNLVVLCKFADHQFGVHTRPPEDYDVLWNAVGGDPVLAPTGSVRDCFLENSYGQLTIDSTVAVWVTLPQTEAFYAAGNHGLSFGYPNNAQGMVKDALDAADAVVDFGEFDVDTDGSIDAISIIHSGYGAETGGGGGNWIWSHRWSLFQVPGTGLWVSSDLNSNGQNVTVSDYHTEPALWSTNGNNISRIGVAVHETGHFFGLPDFYDVNGGGQGAGSWDMMANAWGFDGSQLYPPHLSAYSKIALGWLTPTVIDQPGLYFAPHVEFNQVAYRINAGYPSGEYLLIENRQPVGFESVMPQGGLAIWHIDEAKAANTDQGFPGQPGWPGNNNHYRVAILQADGDFDLERNNNRGDGGDTYHADGTTRIDGTTSPNTDAYQFGSIIPTGNIIANISASGLTMSFTFGDVTTCELPSECDDQDACNGMEICSNGICQAGTPLDCEDDLFCTGVESCVASACQSSGDPCTNPSLSVCDEANDICVECLSEADCDVQEFCTVASACLPYGDGDFDADGDIDLADFGFFQACFGASATPGCEAANLTGDRFVGGDDLAALVGLLTGPTP